MPRPEYWIEKKADSELSWQKVQFTDTHVRMYCDGFVDAMDSLYPSPQYRICKRVGDVVIVVRETKGRAAVHVSSQVMLDYSDCPTENIHGTEDCTGKGVPLPTDGESLFQMIELCTAQKWHVMDLCWELWGSRRAMAYSPNGEKAMLHKYPWLGNVKKPSDHFPDSGK